MISKQERMNAYREVIDKLGFDEFVRQCIFNGDDVLEVRRHINQKETDERDANVDLG